MEDIKENARFKDIVFELPDGTRQVNLDKISEWEPVPDGAPPVKRSELFTTVR